MLLTSREQMINNGIYRVVTGTSQVTASRQLNDLVKKGVLQPIKEYKGRSTAYELAFTHSKQENGYTISRETHIKKSQVIDEVEI